MDLVPRVASSILEEDSEGPDGAVASHAVHLSGLSSSPSIWPPGCLIHTLLTVPLCLVGQGYSSWRPWEPFLLAPAPFPCVPLWVCFLWFSWFGLWFDFLVCRNSLALQQSSSIHLSCLQLQNQSFFKSLLSLLGESY